MSREGSVKSDMAGKSKLKIYLRKEDKISLLLFFTEIIIIGILIALNYILRFDESIRDSSDMIAYERVLLPCDQSLLRYELSRTYFNYGPSDTKSLDGLELDYDLPEWAFFLAAILTPIGIICVFEVCKHFIVTKWKEAKGIKTNKADGPFPKPLPRIIKIVGGYLLGGSIAGLFTSVMKLNIVSPRPNFMSICFSPDPIDYSICSSEQSYWSPFNECTNAEKEVSEGLKSFPSYHATLATYGAIFTSAYIIFSVKFRGTFSSPLLLILGVMVMGVIGATHRLASGYSFPRDIVGGIIIGFFAAYYMIVYRLNEFGRMLNLKKIVQIHNDNLSESSKLSEKKVSQDDTDSDFNDGEPSDFERWATKIDSHKYLPRIQSEISLSKPKTEIYSSQVQAVNPTMKPDVDRFEAKHFPSSRAVTAKRSQSSANKKEDRPSSREDYDTPRQRQSAPMLQEGKGNGYTNYGFSGPANEPKMVLSAYKPRGGNEDFSRF